MRPGQRWRLRRCPGLGRGGLGLAAPHTGPGSRQSGLRTLRHRQGCCWGSAWRARGRQRCLPGGRLTGWPAQRETAGPACGRRQGGRQRCSGMARQCRGRWARQRAWAGQWQWMAAAAQSQGRGRRTAAAQAPPPPRHPLCCCCRVRPLGTASRSSCHWLSACWWDCCWGSGRGCLCHCQSAQGTE